MDMLHLQFPVKSHDLLTLCKQGKCSSCTWDTQSFFFGQLQIDVHRKNNLPKALTSHVEDQGMNLLVVVSYSQFLAD